MNLDQNKNQKNTQIAIEDIDFDFKPITSGLGFHQTKTEVKPIIQDRPMSMAQTSMPITPVKKDLNVYQNDLAIFYNQAVEKKAQEVEEKMSEEQNFFRLASKTQRVVAYVSDLLFLLSILGIVLTVMARTISMDLLDVWAQYPNEITPLVVTLFCGFYLIYFSIFEKMGQSTLGKSMFSLKVLDTNDNSPSLVTLFIRSFVGLLNFVSLGLFSYFDLQNKVTSTKVVRAE